jgi:hypothetical protein
MSEALWLKSGSPTAMVSALRDLTVLEMPQSVLARKFRLFACTCCRRIWTLLGEKSRSAVEVAERYADGQATEQALLDAYEAAYAPVAAAVADHVSPTLPAASAAHWTCVPAPSESNLIGLAFHGSDQPILAEERAREAGLPGLPQPEDDPIPWQCRLLHDLFGNPFRPVWLTPSWLAYEGQLVVGFARGIYEDRAFERLPILADALEEAGCAERRILDHCRQPGQHFPGCWVVDLCLGWN